MNYIHASIKPDRSSRITFYHYYIPDKTLPLFIFFDDGQANTPILFKINGQDFRVERYAPYDLIAGGTDDEAPPFIFPDKGDYTIEALRGEQVVGKAIFHIGQEQPEEPPADMLEIDIDERATVDAESKPEPSKPNANLIKARIDLNYDLSKVDVYINGIQFNAEKTTQHAKK